MKGINYSELDMKSKHFVCFFLIFLLLLMVFPAYAVAANVQITVPAEYSIDGKTSYDLSTS